MKKTIVTATSVFFSTLLLLNTASAQLAVPTASAYQLNNHYSNCAPSVSEKDCLIETAKKVIKTGKDILLGTDLISVTKALSILKKFGINV